MENTRLILLCEDYNNTDLFITNLDNWQLQIVLERAIENDENGIGKSAEEIAEEQFVDGYYIKQLATSEDHIELKDLECKCIANYSYYSFCEIKQ